MREVTDNFYESAYAQETDKVFFHLLDVELLLDNGDLFEANYVNNYLPVTSNGIIYQPGAFEIALGTDINDTVPKVNLNFDTGDRTLIRTLRDNRNKPKVRLSIVLSNQPDIVEIGPVEFEMDAFTIKASAVSCELTYEPILNEPVPSNAYTPTLFPGLYANTSV